MQALLVLSILVLLMFSLSLSVKYTGIVCMVIGVVSVIVMLIYNGKTLRKKIENDIKKGVK